MKSIKSYENICCEDVIKCVFDLNSLDMTVHRNLKKMGETRADDLSKILDKDRSTIYRSLQKLTCCGICTKNTKTIETGGYYHTYKHNDDKKTKEALEKCIDNWYKQMKDTIKNLE